jgi:hypothetical protein
MTDDSAAKWERQHAIYDEQCLYAQRWAATLMDRLWIELAPASAPPDARQLAMSAIPTGLLIAAAQRLLASVPVAEHAHIEEVTCHVIQRVFRAASLAGMEPMGRA